MADEIPRSRGVVSKFIVSKGYGFIKPDDCTTGDLFFHQSQIKGKSFGTLRKGQAVEFFVVKKGDKTKAVSVTVVNKDPADSDGKRNSSGGYGGRNVNSGGRSGHKEDRDCDMSGGGNSRVGGGAGDSGHLTGDCDKVGGVLAVEVVEVVKVVGNIRISGVGGQNSRIATTAKKDCIDFCTRCNQKGHMADDCFGFCTTCNQKGHMADDCFDFCTRCNEKGHIAEDCFDFCTRCNEKGHMDEDCFDFCTRCNQKGHMADDCFDF